MTSGPPDLPRALGLVMALGAVVALVGFGAVALDMWPNLTAGFEPRVVSRVTASGAPELVVKRDRSGHYVVPRTVNGVEVEFLLDRSGHYASVPRTVNGVEVEFLLDTGASDVAIPPTLARQLKLRRGPEVEIITASDVIPGYLVTLDDVSIGPLSLKRVRGSVSEHTIGDEVLLGMSFLRHFELSQRGRSLTLRVPGSP